MMHHMHNCEFLGNFLKYVNCPIECNSRLPDKGATAFGRIVVLSTDMVPPEFRYQFEFRVLSSGSSSLEGINHV